MRRDDRGGNTRNDRIKVCGVKAAIKTGIRARVPITTRAGMGVCGTNDHIIEVIDLAEALLQALNNLQRQVVLNAAELGADKD